MRNQISFKFYKPDDKHWFNQTKSTGAVTK